MEWSREKTILLVGLLQVNAALWNYETKRGKQKRKQELRSIANVFKISVFHITKKIQHLRTQYNRESAREARSQNTNDTYVTNWYAYDYLHFFKDSNKPYRPVHSDIYTSTDNAISPDETKNDALSPKMTRTTLDSDLVNSSTAKRDEFSVFGEYIANELYSLKCERSLLLAKKRIHDVIFDIKMNLLSEFSLKPINVFTTAISQIEPVHNEKLLYTIPVVKNNDALPTSQAPPTSATNEIIINVDLPLFNIQS
ncbi:uncharacterized protein LOC110997386 [Pieris rapae]|uniref:uncharacterized protein LOC110997386 n=1 Tax=Pieris rapae TaxID=64459 RepID=UPI001E27A70F|nr:uncharacterized protein LOC110997386 [Pieris rapae]